MADQYDKWYEDLGIKRLEPYYSEHLVPEEFRAMPIPTDEGRTVYSHLIFVDGDPKNGLRHGIKDMDAALEPLYGDNGLTKLLWMLRVDGFTTYESRMEQLETRGVDTVLGTAQNEVDQMNYGFYT